MASELQVLFWQLFQNPLFKKTQSLHRLHHFQFLLTQNLDYFHKHAPQKKKIWPAACFCECFIGAQPRLFVCMLWVLSYYNSRSKKREKDPTALKAKNFTVYPCKEVCQLLIYDIKSNLKTMVNLKLR